MGIRRFRRVRLGRDRGAARARPRRRRRRSRPQGVPGRRRHGPHGAALRAASRRRGEGRPRAPGAGRRRRPARAAGQVPPRPVRPARMPTPRAATPFSRRRNRARCRSTVARETLVLLQNRDGALPLSAPTRSVAVVGGLATGRFDLLGPHAARGHEEDTVPLLDASAAARRSGGRRPVLAAGCDPLCGDDAGFAAGDRDGARRRRRGRRARRAARHERRSRLARLSQPARPAAAAPRSARRHGQAGRRSCCSAAGRSSSGRIAEKLSAVLMAWYPGTEGAAAITETLFGDVNPSGKLPLTWPRTVGQIPIYYNHLPSGRPTEPVSASRATTSTRRSTPLFPFGFGLSYTTFAFSDPVVATPKLKRLRHARRAGRRSRTPASAPARRWRSSISAIRSRAAAGRCAS